MRLALCVYDSYDRIKLFYEKHVHPHGISASPIIMDAGRDIPWTTFQTRDLKETVGVWAQPAKFSYPMWY